jgi:hypothetical protein
MELIANDETFPTKIICNYDYTSIFVEEMRQESAHTALAGFLRESALSHPSALPIQPNMVKRIAGAEKALRNVVKIGDL